MSNIYEKVMKNKKLRDGIVYSTNPDFEYQYINVTASGARQEEVEDLPKAQQKLRIHLDRLKGNKEATVVSGFVGTLETLETIGKLLKTKCGVGGTVKENEIQIQGNHRDKVLQILLTEGYVNTKKAGG